MLSETSSEGFDDGIEAFSGHRRHVEDAANGLATAGDGAFAFHGAAVAIVGSQADESGDLLTVEFAELRNISDDGSGGNSAEAGNRLHELGFVSPFVVGLDEGLDGAFDVVDLPLQGVEHGLNALPSELSAGDIPAIGFLSA